MEKLIGLMTLHSSFMHKQNKTKKALPPVCPMSSLAPEFMPSAHTLMHHISTAVVCFHNMGTR